LPLLNGYGDSALGHGSADAERYWNRSGLSQILGNACVDLHQTRKSWSRAAIENVSGQASNRNFDCAFGIPASSTEEQDN
jgi:hypothetical protein